jgi:phage repressor protein C with HTH and peptisase S24 domain
MPNAEELMSKVETLRARIVSELKELRDSHYNGFGAEMARSTGVSQSKINRILNANQSGIDAYIDVAKRVSEDLEVNINGLIPMPTSRRTEEKSVQIYDVEVGAGNGIRPVEEWSHDDAHLPRQILRAVLDGPVPEELGLVQVKGESMYPEVSSGDYAFWTPTSDVVDGDAYLIRMDDAILLKILQRKPGNRLRIHSLNPAFSDDIIRKTDTGQWVTDEEKEVAVGFDVRGLFLGAIRPTDLYRASQQMQDFARAHEMINGSS